MDKIATAIAVVLLMSPDFIVPLSLKFSRPTGWVRYAETGSYGRKLLLSSDESAPEIFEAIAIAELPRKRSFGNAFNGTQKRNS
jgi:hypothetical protein